MKKCPMKKCPYTGKVCYPSEEQALRVAQGHDAAMIAYDWCACGQWHLAKKNRKSRHRGDVLRKA